MAQELKSEYKGDDKSEEKYYDDSEEGMSVCWLLHVEWGNKIYRLCESGSDCEWSWFKSQKVIDSNQRNESVIVYWMFENKLYLWYQFI